MGWALSALMAKRSAYRWNDWRVSDGRSIKAKPKPSKSKQRGGKRPTKKQLRYIAYLERSRVPFPPGQHPGKPQTSGAAGLLIEQLLSRPSR